MLVLIASLALLAVDGQSLDPSPLRWSPSGQWIAYRESAHQPISARSGWLFDTNHAIGFARLREGTARSSVWASNPKTGQSVLLDACAGVHTAPAWSANGSSLAFARLRFDQPESESPNWEVVRVDGLGKQRILAKMPVGEPLGSSSLPPSTDASVTWSADGRFLTAPLGWNRGIVVIDAREGRELRVLERAEKPVWSPVEPRLAFRRKTPAAGIYVLDSIQGEPHLVGESFDPSRLPPPVWTRDGRGLLVVRPASPSAGPNPYIQRFRLFRVDREYPQDVPVADLQPELIDRQHPFVAGTLCFDREVENFYYHIATTKPESLIVWASLRRDNEVRKRFNPLDHLIRPRTLSFAPAAALAARFEYGGHVSPPAICDVGTERTTLIAPDDVSRASWLQVILPVFRDLLASGVQKPKLGTEDVERGTILPAPRELPPDDLTLLRCRRLARLALQVCEIDRAPSPPKRDPEFERLVAESRLVFRYMVALGDQESGGDYSSVVDALDRFEALVDDPAQRVCLLGLRVQIMIGAKRFDEADRLLRYLRRACPNPKFEVVDAFDATRLKAATTPRDRWPDFLASSLEKARRPGAFPTEGLDPSGLNFANPDAQLPGLEVMPDPPQPAPAPR